MGDNKPSPRVSVCRSGRQHSGQGSCQRLARKDLQNRVGRREDKLLSSARRSLWWLMPRETSVVWSSTLVCGAQLSQQWSGACLSYTLKVAYSSLLGLFDKCLGTPAGECGISPGDYLWVVLLCKLGCSDHVGRYVSLSDVSSMT